MNTPAHALLNVSLLTGSSRRDLASVVLAGSLLPDLPMFFFYLWVRGFEGLPDSQIWSETYFLPSWQLLFDVFNSIPLALLGMGLASLATPEVRRAVQVFFASILLHLVFDLALHHDDGHRHFLPLSSWRFESPVSYWDPEHFGSIGAGIELVCILAASQTLWRRYESLWLRGTLAVLSSFATLGYTYFYWLRS